MWNKLFLALFSLSVAVMAFFSYYSSSWLNSVGRPADAIAGYEYHSGLACTALVISGILLLALANGVLWATQRAWAIWATFGYVAVFLLIRYFWLGESYFRFNTENGLANSNYSFGPVFGVILIIVSALIVFANQFLSVRLYQKMYPSFNSGNADPERSNEDQPTNTE